MDLRSEEVEMVAAEEEEVNMEAPTGAVPFQLQFDKSIPAQVKIAEWNPEKDLLAMVTDDSKIVLHRFNWQRLWTMYPGKCITSLCWRPDGKVIAVGFEDGFIALHDVENGKLLRSSKLHKASVICLNWEEDADDDRNIHCIYEDRTMRFFPLPPRVPRMPGLSSGDTGAMDDIDDSFQELIYSSHQRFNILCSGDKSGSICFSIFGIFPTGEINIQRFSICSPFTDLQASYHLVSVSLCKVALSKNLCQLIILTYGQLVEIESKSTAVENVEKSEDMANGCRADSLVGLHCLLLDTSIFQHRKHELQQVAQQASSIEYLIEVVRRSLTVMHKQWSDAMNTFHQKFDPLSSLIIDHGLESNCQEEFLSFLFGARTSPPLHQFLVNTLSEAGLKRVMKVVGNAGQELHSTLREHLQPAAEIIGFRVGELRGLSKWRARYQGVGLDEKLIDDTTEKAGMFLVQVERFTRVLATVIYQFQNFFNWLTKCIKHLMSESTGQIATSNSEHVITFVKFHLNNDIVMKLLEASDDAHIEVDLDTIQRVEELAAFGGFSDVGFLGRTLAQAFGVLENSFKEAFVMPFNTISNKITCEYFVPLCPDSYASQVPVSISYDKEFVPGSYSVSQDGIVDYTCFKIPDDSSNMQNGIAIVKGLTSNSTCATGDASLEYVILSMPYGYHCVDLSLFKEKQVVLLLNGTATSLEKPGHSWMMMVSTSELPFIPVSEYAHGKFWKLKIGKDSIVELHLEDGKARSIPYSVTNSLAVSATRGLACVFASPKRALVYILDENEEEVSDME